MAPQIRDDEPGLIRRVLHPISETVHGIRDAFSPEMKEIRERALITEIREMGDGRFIARRAMRITLMVLAFNALYSVGRVLAGKHPWALLTLGEGFREYFFVGLGCLLVGAISAGNAAEKLRKKYPEEFSDEEA
jgi:hypothetical protein